MPGLVLIDGGLGQLHSAAAALEALGILNQPLAALAKREETLYVFGHEDEPILLDRRSPVLHLVQTIRDEAHRFAVTFHRNRRDARTLTTELTEIQGIGPRNIEKLLTRFGSLTGVKAASDADLIKVVGPAVAAKLRATYPASMPAGEPLGEVPR